MTHIEHRQLRASKARRLESALGSNVAVVFDACESGRTAFYLKTTNGLLEYMTCSNTVFDGDIIVSDYAPQIGLVTYYYNRGLLVNS